MYRSEVTWTTQRLLFKLFSLLSQLPYKTILSHSASPFIVMGFFEIEFQELFAWAGFKL
jgi:hypothetical protein